MSIIHSSLRTLRNRKRASQVASESEEARVKEEVPSKHLQTVLLLKLCTATDNISACTVLLQSIQFNSIKAAKSLK